MADNTTLNAGSGGDTIATDDIGGVKHQLVKIEYGDADSATQVSSSNPLPVDLGTNNDVTIDNSSIVKAEDAAHSSTDAGVMSLAVRNDVLASLVDTDGDYAPLQVDADGSVYVTQTSIVDSNNSSTSVLAGDAVFTGTGSDVTKYASVAVFVEASHDSATDGISLELSTDNSNWDKANTYSYVAADGGQTFILPASAQFFRVVYTNGATLQTHFRLETILSGPPLTPTGHRLSDNESAETDGALVKAALMAQQSGSGDFIPIASSASGKLQVSAEAAGAETPADGDATPTDAVPTQAFLSVYNGTTWDLVREGGESGSILVDLGANNDVTLASVTPDLMLGTDFSDVLGTATLITATQADGLVNTTDTVNVSAFLYGFNGTTWDRMDGDATNGLLVNLGTNNDVTIAANSSVNVSQVAGTTASTDNGTADAGTQRVAIASDNTAFSVNATLQASTNTQEVVGDAAHNAATAGNPVLIAGEAQDCDDTAPPNRVDTEGDATQLATDFDGAVFVRPHGPQVWSYHSDGSTALTDDSVHAAPGAGLSIYVTDIVFSSGAATAINCFFEEATTTVLGPYYLEAVAGRGMHIQFATPKKITANTALTVTTSAAIAHSVDVTGFIGQG